MVLKACIGGWQGCFHSSLDWIKSNFNAALPDVWRKAGYHLVSGENMKFLPNFTQLEVMWQSNFGVWPFNTVQPMSCLQLITGAGRDHMPYSLNQGYECSYTSCYY